MIISKTPYRISFFGGGSDYPAYFEDGDEGSVLVTTINKYCYITCKRLPPFFDHKYRISWSKIEMPNSVDEIQHPSARECIRFLGIKDGLSISHDGDLPARTGMGSSSAFTVGLLNALYAYKGHYIDKKHLSENAIYVEQQLIKEAVGCQDQISTAFGGLNKIYFRKNDFDVRPVCISAKHKENLENSMLLFFTGFSRTASDIAAEQIKTMNSKKTDVKELIKFADQGEKILVTTGDMKDFGTLLDLSWQIKRGLTNKISNSFIDDIYSKGIKNGAYGGKLLGAGNGGFMLFIAPSEYHKFIIDGFSDLVHVPIKLDSNGTHITHYNMD